MGFRKLPMRRYTGKRIVPVWSPTNIRAPFMFGSAASAWERGVE